jgi:hypothetical protein
MKKTIYSILAAVAFAASSSCSQELLDTSPTDKVAGTIIFESADAAQVAVNGIYRAMHTPGWGGSSPGWSAENPGYFATPIVKDLHGEDHVQATQGQGWFYFDYAFNVDSDQGGTVGRQYSQWNFYYTIVAQVNYVIGNEEKLLAFGAKGRDVVAQAYALRGFAYIGLYEWFCRGNYAANNDSPGVPVYTEPTTADTKGKGRGKVAELFVQIENDFKKATELFEGASSQSHISHVDKYVAYLLWARAALIQEKWSDAASRAAKALEKPALASVGDLSDLGFFNKKDASSVMWAFEVIADQTGPYSYFLTHMDPEGGYGARAFQCIDAWLWDQIPATDQRKTTWWSDGTGTFPKYVQTKFRFSDLKTNLGDELFLRAEEAVLILAEAACRQRDWATARTWLSRLGTKRDSNYATRLTKFTDASTYNTDTHGTLVTLMDEILFQRRVELWCEGFGRAFDLRRLNLGYTRTYEGSNHPVKRVLLPGDLRFATLIPQKELDSNEAMTIADQNPR